MRLGVRIRSGLTVVLVAGLLVPLGCTRRFYREQADRQVEEVLTEKDCPPWKIETWHAYPDPLARFADPSNPDRPPMPFDDPCTRDLSPNPQRPGKAGFGDVEGTGYLDLIRTWDAINRQDTANLTQPGATSTALPPATRTTTEQTLALKSDSPKYLLTFDQACELALLNSREYQDRREDLYLAALDVTLQRFSFAAQFFAGESFLREYSGSQTANPGNRWALGTTASVSKLFPTGALLLAQFANSVIFEMSSGAPRRVTAPSFVTLDIAQPLLRGGGRAVTLEPLTQVERSLLYTVRAFARFRKLFHVAIAAGDDLQPAFVNGGFVLQRLGLSGTGVVSGYLPTLLRSALVTNQANNVAELERIIAFYYQLQAGGDVSPLQTSQVETQLLNGRSTLLQREQDLRDNLDRFKLQLGVPTDLPMELDNGPVRPLTRHLQNLQRIFEQDRELQRESKPFAAVEPEKLREALRIRLGALPLVQGTPFAESLPARWKVWEELTEDGLAARLQQVAADRRRMLDRQIDADVAGRAFTDEERRQLDDVTYELDLGLVEQALRTYAAKPWVNAFAEMTPEERLARQERSRQENFRRLFDLFVRLLGTARDQRLEQIRTSWPPPSPACVNGVDLLTADFDTALTAVAQAALTNRLDLMNARAQLVDAWRQIAVQANSLFGVVDAQYHLESSNPPLSSNPFGFTTPRTRQFLAINTELPLTRRLERNEYRTALIAYQRQRRLLQAAEDQVLLEVRNELRALRVQAANYKIQQRAVPVAYSQRDNALETLRLPNPPGQASSAGSAAALTQQLLGAQSTVLLNEDRLYQFYINYQVSRLQLFRDLELMPLDPRGVWIDDETDCHCDPGVRTAGRAAPLGPVERVGEPASGPIGATPQAEKK